MTKTTANILIALTAMMLTAKSGVFHNPETGLTEKYYNLNMTRVVKRAQNMGIPAEYWVRDDGVKMFGPWIICAAHPSVTRYTRLRTSLGEAIVLDTHTAGDKILIDIATTW